MTTSRLSTGLAISKKIEPRKRYLKYVEISSTHKHNSHDLLNSKTIAYGAKALKAIRENCKHAVHAKILPFGALRKIRQLRINRNPIKTQVQGRAII